jgi:hypothetical protein
MSNIRDIIKKVLNENHQEKINAILDKINLVGFENLSDYEKSLLGKLSKDEYKYNSIDEEVIDWLDKRYGKFIVDEFTEKSFGRFTNKGFNFLNDDLDLMMKLVVHVDDRRDNILYVHYSIFSELKKEFNLDDDQEEQILKMWLNKTYPNFNFNHVKISQLF